MQVVVQKSPIFSVTPHVLYLRRVGDSVIMHCGAVDEQDYEALKITWSRVSLNKSYVLDSTPVPYSNEIFAM